MKPRVYGREDRQAVTRGLEVTVIGTRNTKASANAEAEGRGGDFAAGAL